MNVRTLAAAAVCLFLTGAGAPPALAQNPLRSPQAGPVTVDPARIRERMAVVSADGQHVGTVDRVEGGQVKLAKDDTTSGGLHHLIPLEWVAAIEAEVRLNVPTQQVRREWKSVE